MERDADKAIHLSGTEARGGEIILRTRRRRTIFLAGLIGAVLLAFLISLAGLI